MRKVLPEYACSPSHPSSCPPAQHIPERTDLQRRGENYCQQAEPLPGSVALGAGPCWRQSSELPALLMPLKTVKKYL